MKYLLKKYAPIYFHAVVVFGFLHSLFTECCNTASLLDFLISIGRYFLTPFSGFHVWLWYHSENLISLPQVYVIYAVLLLLNGLVILISLTSEEVHDYMDEFLSILWGVLIAHLSFTFMFTPDSLDNAFVSFLRIVLSNPLGIFATAIYLLLRYQQYPFTKHKVYLDYSLAGFVTGFFFQILCGTMAFLPMFSSLQNAILIHLSFMVISLAIWTLLKKKLSKVSQQAKDYFAIYHTQAASSDDIKARILSKD